MSSFSLRPGTIDEVVYRAVIEHNEYRIPPHLSETDVIIDIGAHIGSFSWLCWSRGARTIEAFEADPENAAYARRNLQDTSVVLKQMAVWRSDRPQDVLYHSGYTDMLPGGPDPVGVNTGGGNVFSTSGTPLESIALDDIIGDRTIAMLKIDCEGSEYPILLTSQKLITQQQKLPRLPKSMAFMLTRSGLWWICSPNSASKWKYCPIPIHSFRNKWVAFLLITWTKEISSKQITRWIRLRSASLRLELMSAGFGSAQPTWALSEVEGAMAEDKIFSENLLSCHNKENSM
jgi:FkbM family methyltransferase